MSRSLRPASQHRHKAQRCSFVHINECAFPRSLPPAEDLGNMNNQIQSLNQNPLEPNANTGQTNYGKLYISI